MWPVLLSAVAAALVGALAVPARVDSGGVRVYPLVRRRGSEDLRLRRTLDGVVFKEVSQTRKEADGVYFTALRVGSPPQDFTVIVDTGSSTIAIPCADCAKCGAQHHLFDARKSSTVVITKDRYSQCYSEGSCNSGQIMLDVMCLGERCPANETVPHKFGCCTAYAGAFQAQDADGIIGLSGTSETLLANLRNRHDLQTDMFSLCLYVCSGARQKK